MAISFNPIARYILSSMIRNGFPTVPYTAPKIIWPQGATVFLAGHSQPIPLWPCFPIISPVATVVAMMYPDHIPFFWT